MNKYFKLVICIFILALLRFSCSDDDKDDIKLLVTCNAPFTGMYIYNGGNPVGYGGPGGYVISGSTYYYSIIFDDLDSIIVDASITRTGGDTNSYTLTIRIFKDGSEVKKQSINSTGVSTDTISGFSYTYDEAPTT